MFRFNFCNESIVEVENKKELNWDAAEELDLLNKDYAQVDETSLRDISFGQINIKILKREAALTGIKNNTESSHATLQAEKSHSDLLPAQYEGGLKVWECCDDICHYLAKELDTELLRDKDVLDLGCGAGLVGIVALALGAKSITFQDYNQEVLTHWTSVNVMLNSSNQDEVKKKCKFWSGDWESFSQKCSSKFDVILTSETIYNPDNYGKLCQLFLNHLKPDSTIFLAAKSVYFSLGGSVQLFLSYLNKSREDFSWKEVYKSDEGVQRVIMEIKLLKS